MKRVIVSVAAMAVMLGALSLARAAEEVTLKGKLTCAKCECKVTKACQNVLFVKEGEKNVPYYLDDNQISKDYHKNVCKAAKQGVSVTGTVGEKDGKKTIAASKIE